MKDSYNFLAIFATLIFSWVIINARLNSVIKDTESIKQQVLEIKYNLINKKNGSNG